MKQPDLKPKDDLKYSDQINSNYHEKNLFSIKAGYNDDLPLRKTGLMIMPKPKNDAVVISGTDEDTKSLPDTDHTIDKAIEIFSTLPKSNTLVKEAGDEIQIVPDAESLVSKTDEVISSSPERKILVENHGQETSSSSSVITLVSRAQEKITLSPDNDATLTGVDRKISTLTKEELPRKMSY